MRFVAVSCSPHRHGLSARLIAQAAEGARAAGAEAEVFLLAEHEVKPCRACAKPLCWERMECNIRDDDGLSLRRKLAEADALVVCAPVYFLSLNGLAKDFMDRMRYYTDVAKPALPVAVAGGTGKGCLTALQEISRWLVILGFRPFEPLPVTRYDMDIARVEVKERAKRLVGEAAQPRAFSGLAERIAWYESLPFMACNMTDEVAYLARIAIEGVCRRGRPELVSQAREQLDRSAALFASGKIEEGTATAVAAHEESMAVFNELAR